MNTRSLRLLSYKPRGLNIRVPDKYILGALGTLNSTAAFTNTLNWDINRHIEDFFTEAKEENDLDDNEIFTMRVFSPIIAEYLNYEPSMGLVHPGANCFHVGYSFGTYFILVRNWNQRNFKEDKHLHPVQYVAYEYSITQQVQNYQKMEIDIKLLNIRCDRGATQYFISKRSNQAFVYQVGLVTSFAGSTSMHDLIEKANVDKNGMKKAARKIKHNNISAVRTGHDGRPFHFPNGAKLHYLEISDGMGVDSGVTEYEYDPNSSKSVKTKQLIRCENQTDFDECKHIIIRLQDKHDGNIGTQFIVNGNHRSSVQSKEFDIPTTQTVINFFLGATACRCRARMPPKGLLFKIEIKQYQ